MELPAETDTPKTLERKRSMLSNTRLMDDLLGVHRDYSNFESGSKSEGQTLQDQDNVERPANAQAATHSMKLDLTKLMPQSTQSAGVDPAGVPPTSEPEADSTSRRPLGPSVANAPSVARPRAVHAFMPGGSLSGADTMAGVGPPGNSGGGLRESTREALLAREAASRRAEPLHDGPAGGMVAPPRPRTGASESSGGDTTWRTDAGPSLGGASSTGVGAAGSRRSSRPGGGDALAAEASEPGPGGLMTVWDRVAVDGAAAAESPSPGKLRRSPSLPLHPRRPVLGSRWATALYGEFGEDDPAYDEWCRAWIVTKVQSWWRGYKARQRVTQLLVDRAAEAAARAAADAAAAAAPPPEPSPWEKLVAAVCRIQRSWRSHWGRFTYRQLRDLIRYREQGDPAVLLRAINPSEAAFVGDAAAGMHVRFRLGGTSWPPAVYYKMYTHRPVADLGAFAPRAYAAQAAASGPRPSCGTSGVVLPLTWQQPLQPAVRHNKPSAANAGASLTSSSSFPAAPLVDRTGWYVRVENNGWRPLGLRVLDDPVAAATAARKLPAFHPVATVRRAEAAARRKRIAREWRERVYREGRAAETAVPGGADGDAGDEGDEELLAWSAELDFEAYELDWLMLASSGRAEDYSVAGKYGFMVQQNWESGRLPPPTAFAYTLNADNNRIYGTKGLSNTTAGTT